MRTIIAGSRSFNDWNKMKEVMQSIECGSVICGGANGADLLGKMWAIEHGVPVIDMPADWKKYGKSAGMIRNRDMANIADQLVAFWDGISPGTRNMIDTMKRMGKPITVIIWKE
jgi:hypothetical protein